MPRWRSGKKQKSGTNNADQRDAKAFTSPPGRPSTQEDAGEEVSPTEKRAAAMASGEDPGLVAPAKRMRPTYSDGAAAERSPLQYVTVAEAEVRTAIKVCYVRTLGAPPES